MSFTTLMYHEIRESQMLKPDEALPIHVKQEYEDKLPPPLFVTLENFQKQMEYLYENAYHTLTLQEVKNFYKGGTLPEKSVLLTFDDCYQSIKKYAYPILKKYGFHATEFVVTGWLHDEIKSFQPDQSICLTADDLIEMSDVFEYANHTHHFHTRISPTISTIMKADEEDFIKDLVACNSHSFITAKDVFAYPFGLYSDKNVEVLHKQGYQLAFTSKNGWNDSNTNPLLLKRNVVPYFMDMDAFIHLISLKE